ncbi:PREDICTED: uncharacterized protein LOC105460517, partial [Wasmannia auropunctata]|uniref:uncharacterized protein LOC105460517 n=1 Tax=Wasmannia auropunctata TaxID=64793 RepID=UPI0005EEC362
FPFCSVFVIIIQMPYFKSRIFYINESQLHQLDISIEYFIDQEKYYYVILFHISAALFIAITVLTATGAMIMAYLQHVCGMFKIASYRIKNTIEKCIQNINMKNKKLAYKGLIHGVNIHRKAIIFCRFYPLIIRQWNFQ